MDGRTDGHVAIAKTRASIASRGKKLSPQSRVTSHETYIMYQKLHNTINKMCTYFHVNEILIKLNQLYANRLQLQETKTDLQKHLSVNFIMRNTAFFLILRIFCKKCY